MVKFTFFVHCAGWSSGGYENARFANSTKEAKEIVSKWNNNMPGAVTLISIEEISNEEFELDFVGYC